LGVRVFLPAFMVFDQYRKVFGYPLLLPVGGPPWLAWLP
jgi:hypothetical protein